MCTAASVAAAFLISPVGASAQAFPEKPIRMVLPFPPGGVTDILARALAEKLSPRLGQPVIVDNKPGAGTVLASDYVARAPADGYTLLLAASSLGTAPLLYDKVGYDAIKSFAPITQVASVVHVLVVNQELPIKSVAELVTYAKLHPGKLNYASTGTGTSTHLEGELFKSMSKTYMVHIPYKGSGPALTDVVGGQVGVMIDALGSSGPFIKSGKLRALAVTTAKRSQSVPELPTVSESGLPGYEAMPWLGLVAPAGTPQPVIDRIYREVVEVLKEPELRERFKGWGLDIIGNTPAEFTSFLRRDIDQWSRVISSAKIKAD
ncbi:tripartite tricarboxylate transporter substrate binding protein [Variovorax ginsengisoli]|uniref:Tripartite tricarboxylate transporter substrate binding protein n=1 Tax=Variovorax ginsengisoli TaxID=363844 RepID=A0ABT8S9Z5_9BURK|nr:tripartite tricarboxylate transporter substrate binding protein [Variovorax ginsengisoli]MDN8616440.1 tripartite tricarboxylate transporter substrate binding protein [Variovorax ginsengisoli]MDO1535610.1 tripartite tricarboxylate transporter substrate binding protein [Variovorax ginsengisoli]